MDENSGWNLDAAFFVQVRTKLTFFTQQNSIKTSYLGKKHIFVL